MFGAGGHDIDAGGIDGAVTQNICQLGNVLFDAVEGAGEQLTQIVGKHLGRFHPGGFAQLFHCRPDVASIQRFSSTGDEDHTR